jgi:cytochrome c553
VIALVLGCGGGDSGGPVNDATPPLAPLPTPVSASSEAFVTSDACAQCHAIGESVTDAMKTAAGDDVSPYYLWQSTMMAFAARDPFYLAAFEHELALDSDSAADIEPLCIRCHGPAGSEAHAAGGTRLTFAEYTSGASVEARLARDSVTCSLCHQIEDNKLGTDESFTCGFTVGFGREIYGPHQGLQQNPMQMFVQYTPVYAEHVTSSELCTTCHTVIVPGANGGEIIEQAPYLEWKNSVYSTPEQLTT